tara:strand:+ start:332 stop:625 length:294 start_codon:yes stop_codon:yes gene_type:complete
MTNVAKALREDLKKQQAVSNPLEHVVRRLYRLTQTSYIHPWDSDHAYTLIVCAADEVEARELARVCEEERECEQLWDAEHAKIKEICMTKAQVIQVA